MKLKTHRSNAFTLLEIMMVVAIISLLLGSAIYAFKDKLGFAQDTRVKADIQSISTALMVYQGTNGFLPTTEQGLKALVTRPDTNPRPKQWRQQYDKVPMDPWGNEYDYQVNSDESDYTIISYGKDGVAGGDGDNADIGENINENSQ